jgi:hypothetical protein
LDSFQKFGKVWKNWKKVWKNFPKLYLLRANKVVQANKSFEKLFQTLFARSSESVGEIVSEETCSFGVRSGFQTFFQTFSKAVFQTSPKSLEKLALEKSLEKNGSAPVRAPRLEASTYNGTRKLYPSRKGEIAVVCAIPSQQM